MRSDAQLALSLLTAVPMKWVEAPRERTGAASWFPWVGLALGAVGWAVLEVLGGVGLEGRAPLVVGVAVVMGWAALTRMLHWDGLADVADALWGGATPERRLEIMKDSATGAFGATAIALVAIAQTAAIGGLWSGGHWLPVLVAPCFGRLAATCAAWLGSPAREGGLGRSVMGRPTARELVVGVSAVLVATGVLIYGFMLTGVLFAVIGVALALVIPHVLSEPVGGVTGDIMGASVLLTETALLCAFAVVWGS